MNLKEYKINPDLEKCLPPLSDIEFTKLKLSIETQGYDEAKPIVLWKEFPDTIVDGHHRYKICRELGIEPVYIVKSFDSLDKAILYTLQRQIEQRNLTAAQKTEIFEQILPLEEKIKLEEEARKHQISNLKKGDETPVALPRIATENSSKRVAVKIAEKAGVSPATVYRVHAVHRDGAPEVKEMMSKGEVSAKTADKFVKLVPSKEKQKEIIDLKGIDGIRRTVDEEEEKKRLEKLEESRREEDREVEEYRQVLKEQFGDAKYACGIHPSVMMWCDACKSAFDVYRPKNAVCCPVCMDKNIRLRDDSWYPGKKVI